jgi:hypothetical protein
MKKLWNLILIFFSDIEDREEPVYDPVHFAAMIVIVIFSMGVLFWLLWTLLVFGGGLFGKILPAVQVVLGQKTLKDFGWIGYPYEQGIFEGFIPNIIAFILTLALILGIWWLFRQPSGMSPSDPSSEKEESL